ncbi:MAG TPA: phospho-N-acetylmuramoyl-pentapeptide-transferase, partial [Planctomycetaceae bacterium]|nr:phospho-N-acetylmuramoyl-pentapeptide-transferase [Planctomycetaceae bacterium]
SFTLLGAWDDWVKQRTDRNGITARQKMLVQCLLASTAGVLLYFLEPDPEVSQVLFWPVGGGTLTLGWLVIPLAVVVIVATCNSVNLTDGLDGLAAGCTVSCGAAFVALCYLSGHRVLADYLSIPYLSGSGELAVILGGLVGAMLGFLWFNA